MSMKNENFDLTNTMYCNCGDCDYCLKRKKNPKTFKFSETNAAKKIFAARKKTKKWENLF